MINIAICDDDTFFIDYIEKVIVEVNGSDKDINFYEYTKGKAFLWDVEDGMDIDLLILDIKLDDTMGDQVAVEFRKKHLNTTLVFCSGFCNPSPEMIKIAPYRFLIKQYSREKMLHECEEIIDYLKNKRTVPMIKGYKEREHFQIESDDIMYISIARRGTNIHVCPRGLKNNNNNVFHCKKKIEDLYEQLKEYNFVYAHNSYIVNLKYIKKRVKEEIELMNGETLSVSRARTAELKKRMVEYMETKYER